MVNKGGMKETGVGVRMYACMYVTLCVCYYVCCITGACQAQTGPAGYIYYYYLSMLYVCVWCVCLVFCGACSVVFSYMTREIRVARIRLATIKNSMPARLAPLDSRRCGEARRHP